WTDVLALCTADQLQPCSCSMENSLCWSLWFSLGHLHLFFPAEW
ncbi:MPV17L isoform 1, partial [Pan troglodytes]